MSTADGYVQPKPGIPKTLGILNVIFGVLLVLWGTCQVGAVALAPLMMKGVEKFTKEIQAKEEAQSKAEVKSYDDKIAEAKTDEEKKSLEQEKASAIARQPKRTTVDFTPITESMDDPIVKGFGLGRAGSGLILHIMLLIAGIGLIRLAPWGRTMSLWWAGLQIVQVIAVMVVTIVVVLPVQQANMEKMFNKMDADLKAKGVAQGPGPGPGAGAAQMSKSMSIIAIPMTVAGSLTGAIYPIVLLIMLNMAGARAAVLARKRTDEFESF